MSQTVEAMLNTFDALSDTEKRELLREMLRRTAQLGLPTVTDEDLVFCAEELFLRLDKAESADG